MKPIRRLFLDDDPERASAFLKAHPDAVWVKTVAECVEKLAEPWDEVHLDHDLGGEVYVDAGRDDCGMEVVRWIAREPRKLLRKARFVVHSHNAAAAFEMTFRPGLLGYRVEALPFGCEPPEVGPPKRARTWDSLLAWARRVGGRAEPEPDPDEIP